MSRLNVYRSDGVAVDPSFRKELFEVKGMLMDDKAQAETNARLEENRKKLESQQASSAAPILVLMKLRGMRTGSAGCCASLRLQSSSHLTKSDVK